MSVTCDRCGGGGVPINGITGEPIRSTCFCGPGVRVQWPWALICKTCWWELALEAREER